ncbi:hypothetical protein [Okeania sp. KiyG1]|uniref:hypothetical protein n=1 Tax=Okeania sp. KiyG1 TaxID=2720165 RepID=UPI00192162B0|nr:hypothetical protein [Okeania sp. KiyG1]
MQRPYRVLVMAMWFINEQKRCKDSFDWLELTIAPFLPKKDRSSNSVVLGGAIATREKLFELCYHGKKKCPRCEIRISKRGDHCSRKSYHQLHSE